MQARTTEHGIVPRHIRTFLTAEGSGPSRKWLLNLRNEFGHDSPGLDGGRTLGISHGTIKVTAEKKSIFSSIRKRLDGMEKRLGVKLLFVPAEERETAAGKRVTMTCHVYEPLNAGQSEFAMFKRD